MSALLCAVECPTCPRPCGLDMTPYNQLSRARSHRHHHHTTITAPPLPADLHGQVRRPRQHVLQLLPRELQRPAARARARPRLPRQGTHTRPFSLHWFLSSFTHKPHTTRCPVVAPNIHIDRCSVRTVRPHLSAVDGVQPRVPAEPYGAGGLPATRPSPSPRSRRYYAPAPIAPTSPRNPPFEHTYARRCSPRAMPPLVHRPHPHVNHHITTHRAGDGAAGGSVSASACKMTQQTRVCYAGACPVDDGDYLVFVDLRVFVSPQVMDIMYCLPLAPVA